MSGIVKGSSIGLGFKSMAEDLGVPVRIRVHSDSAAAIGISRRRGLGKIRHLAVGDLWVQERLRAGDFELVKMLGSENPADVLTKFTEKPILSKLLAKLNLSHESGRADSAPQIASVDYRVHFDNFQQAPKAKLSL